jgi:hypothetical protein
VAEVTAKTDKEEVGRDVVTFRREDGVAENFRTNQNRELLEKLADQTGGHYYTAADARTLAGQISYSEAGITTRETKDLWDMPMVFLLALMLRGVGVAACGAAGGSRRRGIVGGPLSARLP